MERSRSDRGRDMSRSHTHVGKYPAQNERSGIHGISEREKQPDDISEMGKHEVCIPKPRILVQGILCGHCNTFLWTQVCAGIAGMYNWGVFNFGKRAIKEQCKGRCMSYF